MQTEPGGKSILVVEDNDIAREGLAVVLRQAGYLVDMEVDGAGALKRLREGPLPDLILLDMLLPGVDGWQFMEQRRRDPRLFSVPVVVTTGLGVAAPDWAASLGACGCLRKPIETDALLREVGRCCRNG